VGEVAYELYLFQGSKVHNTFHVSCLKKAVGQHVNPSLELPPLDEEGKLVLEPETILETRERRLRRRVIKEYLVKWRSLPVEGVDILISRIALLEDKQCERGGLVITLFGHLHYFKIF